MSEETDYKLATAINDVRTPDKYRQQTVNVNGTDLIVINLQGQTFVEYQDEQISNPFHKIDEALKSLPQDANILIDLHAEATSDKRAMGLYLDGRVSAVLGTHTHVPTADAQILENGTGYITDVGMTGSFDSVIGIKKDIALKRFLTLMPHKLEVAKGLSGINAVVVEIDEETGRSLHIYRIQQIIDN